MELALAAQYQANRIEAFKRDKYTCQGCYRTQAQCQEVGNWLEAHHKPRGYTYGKETVAELLTLCNICHEGITTARRAIRYGRYIPPQMEEVQEPEKPNVPGVRQFDVPLADEGVDDD